MNDCYRNMKCLLLCFNQDKHWGTIYTLEILYGIWRDYNWNQTLFWLLPISSFGSLTILKFSAWNTCLINKLHTYLHLRTCFWHIFIYAFILGQRKLGMQEKGEYYSMAWHLSLSTPFDWFGTTKNYSLCKKGTILWATFLKHFE